MKMHTCTPGAILVHSWCNPGALLVDSWCAPGALLVHSWCTPSAIAWEFYWRLTLVHFDVENMTFFCPHATAPGVHQDGTRSAPGLHQECTRSTKGVHQECARSAPGALWRIFSMSTLSNITQALITITFDGVDLIWSIQAKMWKTLSYTVLRIL